ncbi:MAG: energy transducer TonB [Pyrinomonadaceae bacterium]
MNFFYYIILLIFTLSISGSSQTEKYSVSEKWEKFQISDKKVQITFPKLPVKLTYTNECIQTETTTFYANADGVVYELKIVDKIKKNIPTYCTQQKEKFDESRFSKILAGYQTNSNFGNLTRIERDTFEFNRFENNSEDFKQIKWLVNDYKNYRYFELTISTYKEKIPDEKRFVESLSFQSDLDGIEIKDGAERFLGDEDLSQEKSATESKEESKTNLLILTKPKPSYTDKARKSNTTGEVRLRVTFLANGGIGEVTPVTGLKNGLTEQAIKAAQKIAFLPQKYGDKKVSITKVVVYTFTIY